MRKGSVSRRDRSLAEAEAGEEAAAAADPFDGGGEEEEDDGCRWRDRPPSCDDADRLRW